MEDIVPRLLKLIRKDFLGGFEKSELIAKLYAKARDGTASYLDANDFAIEIGKLLSEAYQNNLSSEVLPDGHMYFNIADRIITPTMENNHELIMEMAAMVQSEVNKEAGLGIKVIKSEVNSARIKGIIEKIVATPQFDDVKWVLGEPVINFSQNVILDMVETNADFHYNSGVTGKIIRKSTSKCCDWCNRLVGVYVYPDVPKDVYRRHDYCRCTIDYKVGSKSTNIHNNNTGKRTYVKDEYGDYVKSEYARIQKAREMAATKSEREKAAKEKRIETWKEKKKVETIQLSENASDITKSFFKNSRPGIGEIINSDTRGHPEETQVAKWILKNFGGKIELIPESPIDGIKTPDFLWNNEAWELKNVSTRTSVDNQIHKAIKQLYGDKVGIFLDIKNRKISEEDILNVIIEKSEKRAKTKTKIVIKDDDRVVKIIEINKDRQT